MKTLKTLHMLLPALAIVIALQANAEAQWRPRQAPAQQSRLLSAARTSWNRARSVILTTVGRAKSSVLHTRRNNLNNLNDIRFGPRYTREYVAVHVQGPGGVEHTTQHYRRVGEGETEFQERVVGEVKANARDQYNRQGGEVKVVGWNHNR